MRTIRPPSLDSRHGLMPGLNDVALAQQEATSEPGSLDKLSVDIHPELLDDTPAIGERPGLSLGHLPFADRLLVAAYIA